MIQSLVGLGPRKTHLEGRITRRSQRVPAAAHHSSGGGGGAHLPGAAAAAAAGRFLSSLVHQSPPSRGGVEQVPVSTVVEELFRFEGDLAGVVVMTDCKTGEKRALWVRARR